MQVGVVVLATSLLGSLLIDGASFTAWLESVSTLAAVLAAMYAGFYAANAWKLEVEREERWAAQQRTEQASKVAAWPDRPREHVTGHDEMTGAYTKEGFDGLHVWLRNASDVPVTQVSIDATLVVRAGSTNLIRIDMGTREVARLLEPTTEPVKKFVEADAPVNPNTYKPGNVEIAYWFEVSLNFRDAGGRVWERSANGQLIPVSDGDASA
jgi:hypothetical protein